LRDASRPAPLGPSPEPARISPLAPFCGVSLREVRESIAWQREYDACLARRQDPHPAGKGGGA